MTSLSERQQIGRAKNALREYFVRKLAVPKIFFDAVWQNDQLDLLAIDRAGVGDAHALRFVRYERVQGSDSFAQNAVTTLKAAGEVDRLHSLPAQYRYVAVIGSTGGLFLELTTDFKERTFPEDGIGRVGVLSIDFDKDDPAIQVVIKPERFRSTAKILALTDEYVATHTPVDEYRDPVEYQVSA